MSGLSHIRRPSESAIRRAGVLFQTASAPCRAGYRRPPLGRFGHPSSNHLSGKRAVKV
ncbi:hypothetical protein [Neisseria sp. oral taxon 014]|uniref:hypothetical protein n=1 Tax=Neisseria sp. oral taxon 014 TaxID=641148 RepID=UPI0025D28D3C|nr:hypothetical protein [Neisseria sp. oral taxon 014]